MSSPLHWIYSFRELYSSRINPHLAPAGNLKELLVMVLERINPCVLETSMTLGRDGRLLEACWQFEVYRAATSVLAETVVSTNVGQVCNNSQTLWQCALCHGMLGEWSAWCTGVTSTTSLYGGVVQVWGAKGYVDFYLPEPLCMALELTRDSDRWQEHLQRFEPPDPQAARAAGKYYPMIECGAVKHWAVVDFLSPPKQQQSPPPQQHARLYSVSMLSWDSAEIWHMGELVVPCMKLTGTTNDAINMELWEALRNAMHRAQGDQPPLPMEE